VLDQRLAQLSLPSAVSDIVQAERGKLGGAVIPAEIEPALRDLLHRAFDEAYIAGFRSTMIVGAVLAALGAVSALVFIEPESAKKE
jgi:hypothetical protein